MRKRSFTKRKHDSGDMSLQITSMADIFIILLVFMLKGYTTGMNVTPAKGMLLPEAHAAETQVEALKVEITEGAVSIEGQPVAILDKFQFDGKDLKGNGTASSLTQVFERERKRQLLIAKTNSDVKIDPKMVVVSDKRAPYSTIKAVLASGAVHGYTDFKLAVIKGE